MKNIARHRAVVELRLMDRGMRRDAFLERKMHSPCCSYAIANVIWQIRCGLGLLSAKERALVHRKEMMEQQERRTYIGTSHLMEHASRLRESNNLFHGRGPVTAEAANNLGNLYSSAFGKTQPEVMQHIRLTRAYAGELASRVQRHIPQLSPHALGAMGLLRNVAMFFGERGYHRKDLVSRDVCRELGIHPQYIAYLRPPTVDASGVSRKQYGEMSPEECRRRAQERGEQCWRELTLEQKLLELSGFLAKTDETGQLRTFDDILENLARKTRETPEAYRRFVGQPPLFCSSRSATDSLNPEFEEAWIGIYRRMREELREKYGVDLEEVRQAVAARTPPQVAQPD